MIEQWGKGHLNLDSPFITVVSNGTVARGTLDETIQEVYDMVFSHQPVRG